MDINFTPNSWEDIEYWIENDPEIITRIKDLIKSIRQDPFKGLGKPEPLKYEIPPCWSRRINKKDRLVYRIHKRDIHIISILGHYND